LEKDLNVNIKAATVTIQILTVDGKRMTKSVFNQILVAPCLNINCEFIGDEIFGFVKDNDGVRYLVWTIGGKLRKTRLRGTSEIKEHGTGLFGPKFWNLTIQEKDNITKLYENFLNNLIDKQVFISI
jgi:hypothetical protein